jgi:hypothetical protein
MTRVIQRASNVADDRAAAKCPHCGGTSLSHGKMGNDVYFLPDDRAWLSIGWGVRAFVCLGCGVITQRLSEKDLEIYRAKFG